MDEKKVREAIKMLRREKKECKELLNFYGKDHWNYGLFKKKIAALETGIKALEKQLPKKVVDKSLVKDNGSVIGSVGKCPNCNEIIDNTMAVCDCGQKINWSERNE